MWFSLIDKIYADRTLGLAWEKVSDKRANGHSLEAIAKRLQPKLAGFYGYFKQASATTLSSGSGSGPRKAPRFNFS